MAKRGFRFISVGSDAGMLRESAAAALKKLKGELRLFQRHAVAEIAVGIETVRPSGPAVMSKGLAIPVPA